MKAYFVNLQAFFLLPVITQTLTNYLSLRVVATTKLLELNVLKTILSSQAH